MQLRIIDGESVINIGAASGKLQELLEELENILNLLNQNPTNETLQSRTSTIGNELISLLLDAERNELAEALLDLLKAIESGNSTEILDAIDDINTLLGNVPPEELRDISNDYQDFTKYGFSLELAPQSLELQLGQEGNFKLVLYKTKAPKLQ